MLTFIFLLAFQGFSGGVAGYITNKYAVDMLFKEYTPLKLGGVIKKKKEKFIEEISELVERDIINADTLRSEMPNININTYIKQMAQTFFEKQLSNSLGNTKIAEIDGFSESILKSEEFIRNNLNILLPELIDGLMRNVDLQDILSEKQISKVINSCYELLICEFENADAVNGFISDLYKENSNITLADIFSKEVQKKLTDNIIECVENIFNNDILSDEKSCKMFLDNMLSNINVDATLVKLQDSIGSRDINHFITETQQEEVISRLFIKITEFINSSEGKDLILKITNEIVSIGKNIDFTIYEILPKEMKKSLTNFIKIAIPKVMPYILEWISSNKSSLDEMIESAIDEAIQDIDESIKKLIISKVRNALMGDVSSKNNIVNKIISYINNNFDDESSDKIVTSIIDYLKDTKVKNIVESLEKYNLATSDDVAEIITKVFAAHGKNTLRILIKSQFSKKVNEIAKLDLLKLFNTKLKPMLYESIFKNKTRLCKNINTLIAQFINSKSDEIFHKKLSELFKDKSVFSLSNKFSIWANNLLRKNKDTYSEKLEEVILSNVKKLKIGDILSNYNVNILEYIVDNSVSIYREAVDKYKNYQIKELVNKGFNKDQLSNILINKGYPALISKLPSLLNGNIKKIAKNSLSKYDEDEICDIVQDFMGSQLKPLSVFGAVLGTVVGIIYQLIFPNSIGLYGFPSNMFNGLLSLGVMAFIGYITNVVALWMIFHPYKENKIISKIPFFKKFALGYIPAHKNEFAIGMAKLIDEELLNKEEINKSFNSHKDNMSSVLTTLVKNNNYQILVNFSRSKKNDFVKYIYKIILKYCNSSSGLSEGITNRLKESKFDNFIKESYIQNGIPKIISSISNSKSSLTKFIENKISSNYKIGDVISEDILIEIQSYIQEEGNKLIQDNLSTIEKVDFIDLITKEYKDYYSVAIKQSCKEVIGKDSIEKAKVNIGKYAYEYFSNDFKIYLENMISKYLCNGLDENNDVGSMFDGRVKNVIDNNLHPITSYFSNKLIVYLKNNQNIITENVQETIKSELNFFEKIAYATFGGDDIAYRVVDIILNKKLPLMLREENDKLINTTKAALNESIYPIRLSELNIKGEEFNIRILINNLFEQFDKNVDFEGYIYNASDLILDSLAVAPLSEYLELFGLSNLDSIYKKFFEEVNIIKEDIYRSININKDKLSITIEKFFNENMLKNLFNIEFNSVLLKGIDRYEIENCISNILSIIIESEESKKSISMFMESFYENTLSELKIEQIIDVSTLSNDLDRVIKYIFANAEFNQKIMIAIDAIVQNAINNNFYFISDRSKDYLISKTIETGLNSVGDYIVPILRKINLKNISNKQIELLNPKEIDVMFNSFAGDFFNKLRLYGVFGFVFGINAGLSFILWIIDWRYSKKYNDKNSKALKEM
ncbi:MAG: DUF445 family protein [Clostridium beijerinckii]|jgi:uncharacterized membrane protein YheB (UPF0754 family)|nr:DUF445 family protein [Clostridium beijerinckii]MCI1579870.1 DUF445 family protein [Clostridium beijerinckii]MCI1582215.1 DUF445 family protein [Clostridium beijerinckii]MCI1622732.1 DUF445 family protein [Clostridium beijerinckii]